MTKATKDLMLKSTALTADQEKNPITNLLRRVNQDNPAPCSCAHSCTPWTRRLPSPSPSL